MVEKFADYWNKDNVHIDRITYLPIVDCDRAARQPEVRRARSARAAARDRHQGRACGFQAQALRRCRSWLPGHHDQCRERRQGEEPARPARQGAPGARTRRSIARRSTRSCSTASSCPGNQWVSPENPYYQKSLPVPKRDVAKAKALIKEAGVHDADRDRLHGAAGRREQGGLRGRSGDGGGSRLRHEDPRHRVRDFAEAGRAGRVPGLPDRLERPHRSGRQSLHLLTTARRRRTTAADTATRRSTSAR